MTVAVPECTACGVCCFFDDPRYVMVFDDDLERLGPYAESMTHMLRGRRFMLAEQGHCIALRQAGEHYLCSIYEHRPQLCRDFQRGCDTCQSVVERWPRLSQLRAQQDRS